MTNPHSPNHFESVRQWLSKSRLSEDRAFAILERYCRQHDHPFSESNKAYYIALILAFLFFLRLFGVQLEIRIFELNLIAIPNALFILPIASLICLSYAAVRAADAAYYQKLIEIIADESLQDDQKVIARGHFGGAIISGNFLDVWRTIPSRGFRFWFVALASTSGLLLFVLTLLPFAAGLTYLVFVEPEGAREAQMAQMAAMLFAEIVALIAGMFAIFASDLDSGSSRGGRWEKIAPVVRPQSRATPDAKQDNADAADSRSLGVARGSLGKSAFSHLQRR